MIVNSKYDFFFPSVLIKRANSDVALQPMVDALSSFKDINTILIKPFGSEVDLNRCIEATKRKLKDLVPSERRYIRVWHKSNNYSEVLFNWP